jgi:hypothetical protein
MTILTLQACPRCQGAVIDYSHPPEESAMSIVCGSRDRNVPKAVADEVSEHPGRPFVEHSYTHHSPYRGGAPLSGWYRGTRRRLRAGGVTEKTKQLNVS